MQSRPAQFILVLVTLAAIGFAVYMYALRENDATTVTPSPSASVSPSASPTPSGTPTPDVSAAPTTDRTYTDKQALSLTNQIATLQQGSSLFQLAQEYELSALALAKLNGIADQNKVVAGQTLIIPDNVTTDTYTVLFITNPKRLEKEVKNLASGTSIYVDPVASAQADVKGIYNISGDTPYSKSAETATTVTLNASDADKIVTINMEKHTSGLWVIKKLTIKVNKEAA